LRGAFRLRRILLPQLRSRQRIRRTLRGQCDFSRALRHARVVRVTREREVGLIRGRGLIALQRDFRREHLEHNLARQRDAGQIGFFVGGIGAESILHGDGVVIRIGRLILRMRGQCAERPDSQHGHTQQPACGNSVRHAVRTGPALQKLLNDGQVHTYPFNVSVDCNALATISA